MSLFFRTTTRFVADFIGVFQSKLRCSPLQIMTEERWNEEGILLNGDGDLLLHKKVGQNGERGGGPYCTAAEQKNVVPRNVLFAIESKV